ncbi:MAG: aliphatic sulfonate ABC transporter substrate-binding protein [Firmicutes bacterium]|nr:aliphatic sulfonate ABC transporter substrate-binding protein [Bacillota bacterium]
MKRVYAIVCLLLLSLLLFSGCGSAEPDGKQLRIAYFPNITHSQALVMKEQASLEAALGEDCSLSWTAFNAGPAEVEAMFAGEIDLGFIGPVPAISANVKSQGDFVVIAGASNGGAALVIRNELDFRSVADLSGKVVAIPQLGNTQHLSLLNLLSENGLSPKSEGGNVEVVAAGNADILNMMDQGSIDAALVPEPWASTILAQTDSRLAMEYDEIWMGGNYSTAVVIVSKDFLEESPEIVSTFLEVHKATTQFIQENPEAAAEMANRQIEAETGKLIEESILQSAFERLRITYALPEESLEAFAQLSYDEGFISALPDEGLCHEDALEALE